MILCLLHALNFNSTPNYTAAIITYKEHKLTRKNKKTSTTLFFYDIRRFSLVKRGTFSFRQKDLAALNVRKYYRNPLSSFRY